MDISCSRIELTIGRLLEEGSYQGFGHREQCCYGRLLKRGGLDVGWPGVRDVALLDLMSIRPQLSESNDIVLKNWSNNPSREKGITPHPFILKICPPLRCKRWRTPC